MIIRWFSYKLNGGLVHMQLFGWPTMVFKFYLYIIFSFTDLDNRKT